MQAGTGQTMLWMKSIYKQMKITTRNLKFDFQKSSTFIFFTLLALKLTLLFLKLKLIKHHLPAELRGFWGTWAGDSVTYTMPFEELKMHGAYVDGFRMPLYGFAYYIFRAFLNQVSSLNAMLLLQIVVSSISIVYVGKIVALITGKSRFALSAVIISFLSFQVSLYDWYVLPQSLVTAFLIFYAFHSISFLQNNKNTNLFFAVFFCYCILFLYPIFFPVILFIIALTLFSHRRDVIPILKRLFLVLVPFVFIHSLWVYRNYKLTAPPVLWQ